MSEEDIKKTIFGELKKIAPDTQPEKLQPDENIRQTLDIDSFDFLQFIVSLDAKMGINILEQDYGKISTLKNLVSYLTIKKNELKP